MYSLDKIREEMQKRLTLDKQLDSVEVNADSIDEALADASVQLDTKAKGLEFEVIERGSSGFLGIGKKPWKLRVYQNPEFNDKNKKAVGDDLFIETNEDGSPVITNRDGLFYVRHFGDAIKLKVLPPIGSGNSIDVKEVLDVIQRPDTIDFDEKLITKLVSTGTNNEYEKVGSYKHVSAADSIIAVEISRDEMHGNIIVDAPGMSGSDLTYEQIYNAVEAQGVRAGIIPEKIIEFVDNPVYSTPFEVASAVLPEDGKDAYIQYNFETDQKKLKARESDKGNVDFKELNRIQNVVEGQVLATKIPATRGKGGKTILGHYLEAKNGKDINIQLGQNVHLDKDGVNILASVDGQVLFINDKITVEPLLMLDAVNIKSGNVKFVGSVIVKGNVEDGFDVRASGTIDIGGSVGKCHIESENGDIIVHQGVFGKDEGYIKAGKSLWGKFIQSAKIEVEENVIASDSLMNCDVTAMKNIVLYGKKAQITGGTYFATEEICARTIGSAGGSDTTLSVGIDPRAKKRLDELQEMQADLMKELENVELDITTLENQKKIRKSLSQEKEENLSKLIERKDKICSDSKEASKEIESLQQHLRDLKAAGKVKVEGTIYAGTKVYVRDALEEVTTDVKSLTFYYEGGFLKRGKYEPPSSAIKKGPEGYTN